MEPAAFLLAVGLGLCAVWAILHLPLPTLLRDWSCDDSFYYAQVARRMAGTGFSSFDGIEPTNGYHPLWLFLQVPLHWLAAERELALRLTRCFEVVLGVCSFLLLRSGRRRAGMHPACDLLVLLLLVKTEALYEGLETGVLLAALGVVLVAWQRHAVHRDRRGELLLGGALLAAGLARIEVFALAPVAAWLAASASGTRKERVGAAARILLLPLVGGAVYAAVNWAAIGSPVPISGVVKAWWSDAQRGGPPSFASLVDHLLLLSRSGQVRDGLQYGLVSVVLMLWYRRRPLLPARRVFHAFVAALAVLHLARLVWFSWTTWPPFGSYSHYWVTGRFLRYLVWVVAADLLLGALGCGRGRRVAPLVAFALLALALHGSQRALDDRAQHAASAAADWEIASWRGVQWMNARLRERAGAFDAGVIGYFCDQPVTNLDGLIASPAYFAEVRAGRGDEAAAARGVRYVANVVPASTADFAAFLQMKWALGRRPRGTFTLLHADADCRPLEEGTEMQFRVYRWDP